MAGYIGKVPSGIVAVTDRKKVFTAAAGQTDFDPPGGYTPNAVHVFQNGVRLVDGTDFTATDGTTVELTNGANADDQVVIISHASYQAADSYTKSEADGNFVASGVITVDESNNRVGINETSPSSLLVVKNTSGNDGIRIHSGNSGEGYLIFRDDAQSSPGGIAYRHSDDSFEFKVGNVSDQVVIDTDEMTVKGRVSGVGNVIKVTKIESSSGTNVTVSGSLVAIAASIKSVTAVRANSSYLYDVTFSAETDITAANRNGFFVLQYRINSGSWVQLNNVINVGGVSDAAGGTSNNNAKFLITPTTAIGDTIEFRVLFQKSDAASFYFNQQSLGSQPSGTTNVASGIIAEIGT